MTDWDTRYTEWRTTPNGHSVYTQFVHHAYELRDAGRTRIGAKETA